MPYYCTVPRCTSMAGKAKNVSFHQFPRDELLAQRWNIILKRGKPYTKYSKVCSRHFLPEDYTVTNVNRQKGHWRSLRKDAVPSQNLPNDEPHNVSDMHRLGLVDHRQQLAHVVYLQTMLAVHAASMQAARLRGGENTALEDVSYTDNGDENQTPSVTPTDLTLRSYKCEECLKCFMDPDVLKLHMRTHWRLNSLLIRGDEDERRWHKTPVDDGKDRDEDCYESDDQTELSRSQDANVVSWHKSIKTSEGYESPGHCSDYGKASHELPGHCSDGDEASHELPEHCSDYGKASHELPGHCSDGDEASHESPEHCSDYGKASHELPEHCSDGDEVSHESPDYLNTCNSLLRREENCESKKFHNGNNAEWNESLVSDRESPTCFKETNVREANLENVAVKNVLYYELGVDRESLMISNNGIEKKLWHESEDETSEDEHMHKKREFKKPLNDHYDSPVLLLESKLDKKACTNETAFGDSQWHEVLVNRAKSYESPVHHGDYVNVNGGKDSAVVDGDVAHWIDSHSGVVASPESNGVG